MTEETSGSNSLELATELTIAWLSNPNTRASADDVPAFLERMHASVDSLSTAGNSRGDEPSNAEEFTPAVSARKSLASKDHIISMIDGKPYKALRRHLTTHGLTPDQYRERYGLKPDYPMVSEAYSQVRRDMAKQIGLGRKAKGTAGGDKPAPAATKTPRRRVVKPAEVKTGD